MLNIRQLFRSPPSKHFFGGYYDRQLFDPMDENRLLAHGASFSDRMPLPGEPVDIGYFDWRGSGEFNLIDQSFAWNWQQGSQLQWLGQTSSFIYNDLRDGAFCSVIVDLDAGRRSTIDSPIYDVSPCGKHALTIDYERHFWLRKGYHYEGVEIAHKNRAFDPEDGIYSIDLQQGTRNRILSLGDIASLQPLPSMAGTAHYLEHMMFSPCGRRFCFLHRWRLTDGGIYSRLLTAGIGGDNVRIIADSGRMSHFSWLDSTSIIAFGGTTNTWSSFRKGGAFRARLMRALLPIYRKVVRSDSTLRTRLTGDGYMIIPDSDGPTRVLEGRHLRRDGHPTRSPVDPGMILTDTYEDGDSQRTLMLFEPHGDAPLWSAKIPSCSRTDDTSMRADLHPKWSHSGELFSIDTSRNCSRRIEIYGFVAE